MKQLLINFVLSYLRYFARKALTKHHPTIIGVTGSAGKSSTRTLLYTILKDHFPTKMVSGNSETGVPLGILGMKPENYSKIDWLKMLTKAPLKTDFLKTTKYLIVEMGIDDPYPPKNMEYLLTIVRPDIAVYLNAFAGAVHSMQFEKILPEGNTLTAEEKREIKANAIAAEKAKIITQSGCAVGIYNADNQYVAESLQLWDNSANTPVLTFGEKQAKDLILTDYEISLKGTTFQFAINSPVILSETKNPKDTSAKPQYDKRIKEKITISTNNYLLQKDYGLTIGATILTALQTGLTTKQIKTSLENNFLLPRSRATMLDGIHNSIIIDSSYNASRTAVEGMLDLMNTLKKQTKRPTVLLFGDMRELGEESQIEHQQVAGKIIGIVDYLYLVGPQTREYVLPVIQTDEKKFKEIRWFDTAARVGEYLEENLPKESIVLVKGSQNTIFLEEAIKYVLKNKKDEKVLCRQEQFWLEKKSLGT